MAQSFLEGLIKYPEDLPCPQVDTDLVPRERRYISDIMDVRNMRMFQQEFQATRNRISFVFTEEEAREFREWYENELIHGGAWFYADWPTLHKDKKIAHRFVGQPKYEWLFGGNPGAMGRSSAGVRLGMPPSAVTMYKVTATVELYERKVGSLGGIYTSRVYPILVIDDVKAEIQLADIKEPPNVRYVDDVVLQSHTIPEAVWKERLVNYTLVDDAVIHPHAVVNAEWTQQLKNYNYTEDAEILPHEVAGAEWTAKLVTYDYFDDDVWLQAHTIVAAEFGT